MKYLFLYVLLFLPSVCKIIHVVFGAVCSFSLLYGGFFVFVF